MRTRLLFLPAAILALLLVGGCGDTQTPGLPEADEAQFDGNFDADGGSFLLSRIDQPGFEPLRVDLIGSNLRADSTTSTLSIDVAVRNRGDLPLYPRAIIWISKLDPPGVTVINADLLPPELGPMDPSLFGFDYSGLLGEDGVLESGETSEPRTWVFSDPGLQSFSFFARAEFGAEPPPLAGIHGRVFNDENRDGVPQPDEGAFPGAMVEATTPSGDHLRSFADSLGHYRIPVKEAGLYELRLEILVDCIYCITTPNPLQVIIASGPDGQPLPYDHADFGAVMGPCGPPPVTLVPGPPDDVQPQDEYHLLAAHLEGTRLHLRVGFSGCSPDHFFELFAGLPEPEPELPELPHTWLRLAHDSHGEECLAWFERDLFYELRPILDAFAIEPGFSIHLTLEDPTGQVVEFELERQDDPPPYRH